MFSEQGREAPGQPLGGGETQRHGRVRRDGGAAVLRRPLAVREPQHQEVDAAAARAQEGLERIEQRTDLAQHGRLRGEFVRRIVADAVTLARHEGTTRLGREADETVEVGERIGTEAPREPGARQTQRRAERTHTARGEPCDRVVGPAEHGERQRRERPDQPVARQHRNALPCAGLGIRHRARQGERGERRRRERPTRRCVRRTAAREQLRAQRLRSAEQLEAAAHLEQHGVGLEAHARTEVEGEPREAVEVGSAAQRHPGLGRSIEQGLERRRHRR